MKQTKRALLLVSILIMLCIWGFIAAYRTGYIPTGLDLFIFALIMIAGIYAFVTHLKQHKDVQSGFPAEDEMSTRIKYKAGYYAFLASMYMWLFIFLFKDFFPDVETMLGGGILLSAALSIVIKTYLTRNYHEDQN
ncbi:hypothetical protein ACFL3I_07145 [Pseudomonadota bacterium]